MVYSGLRLLLTVWDYRVRERGEVIYRCRIRVISESERMDFLSVVFRRGLHSAYSVDVMPSGQD